MPETHAASSETPRIVAQGKTKIIYEYTDEFFGKNRVRIFSKDDITAGDGAKRDLIPGKGKWANMTNAHVMVLLHECGLPVAFDKQISDTESVARRCDMLPYEVVARRLAMGSYLKRNPEVKRGERFDALVVEFFLKTSGKNFKGIPLPCDDPLIVAIDKTGANVCRPDVVPLERANIRISGHVLYGEYQQPHEIKEMEELVRRVFLVLEKAWMDRSFQLCDIKIEFGKDYLGELLIADVITNDEWRVIDHMGDHLDKQRYREGDDLANVAKLYEEVANLTDDFPYKARGVIVLWRGSENDPKEPFEDEMDRLKNPAYIEHVVGSMHKQTKFCLEELKQIERQARSIPHVIIAHVGKSNGLGPTLKGNTLIPVISVPIDEADALSSLRLPSDVPMPTIFGIKNGVQAALDILALQSPHAYMARRYVMEEKWLNEWTNSPSKAYGVP